MFEVFPVICLSDQLDAINHRIVKNNLRRNDILGWLDLYGELVMPNQDHSLRTHIGFIFPIQKFAEGIALIYIFQSRFGKINVFRFVYDRNTIMISSPLNHQFYTNLEHSMKI